MPRHRRHGSWTIPHTKSNFRCQSLRLPKPNRAPPQDYTKARFSTFSLYSVFLLTGIPPVSQHYLQKNAEHAGYTASCYPSSTSSMVSAFNAAHRMRPPEASWSRAGYVPASRSIVYAASDSPGCHVSIISGY